MDKVVNFPRPDEPVSDVGSGTLDRANRTFICTVLFLDIIEYAKKPVSQQLRVKEQFNARLSEALQDIAANDRIILDTGDGAAINFLGDPEDALFVAMSLAHAFSQPPEGGLAIDVRIGINLGPVRLVRDINGQPQHHRRRHQRRRARHELRQQRSAGWFRVRISEVVTRISEDYGQLFAYQGSRTDKHVREHEIYAVASSGTEAARCGYTPASAHVRAHRPSSRSSTARKTPLSRSTAGNSGSSCHTWSSHFSCLALISALVYYASDRAGGPRQRRAEARVQDSTCAAASAEPPHAATEASIPATPDHPANAGTSEARPTRTAIKKPAPAHKEAGQPSTAAEAPAVPVPAAVKTPADAAAPTPAVTPLRPMAPAATDADVTPASPYTPAPKGPSALVMFAVSPWGEVLVDGKSMGVSPPLSELELKAGTHRVEIRNGDFTPHLVTLQLESNQTIRIKHKFTQR
jgi:hypothetical protein